MQINISTKFLHNALVAAITVVVVLALYFLGNYINGNLTANSKIQSLENQIEQLKKAPPAPTATTTTAVSKPNFSHDNMSIATQPQQNMSVATPAPTPAQTTAPAQPSQQEQVAGAEVAYLSNIVNFLLNRNTITPVQCDTQQNLKTIVLPNLANNLAFTINQNGQFAKVSASGITCFRDDALAQNFGPLFSLGN